MKERYLSNTDFYIWMYYKFKNPVIPGLYTIVTGYLIDNREKIDLYLDRKLKVDNVLEYIAKRYKETKQNNILQYVIEYVEGPRL